MKKRTASIKKPKVCLGL